MRKLINIIICLFPILLYGQKNKDKGSKNLAAITIGMEVPVNAIGKTVEGKHIAPIRDLSQDLIILDFMNTSCTSCIEALPRLNTLQQDNEKALKIISISYEDMQRVNAFRKNNKLFKSNKLDFVVEDTTWAKYFPHQTVSHMVWIYKGRVVAITFSEFVDQYMVDQVLSNGKIDLPIKNDFLVFDFTSPLIGNNKGRYSFVTGFIEGAATNFGQQVDSVDSCIREYIVNAAIIPAFLYCYGKMWELPYIKDSRIIVQRPDHTRFVFDKEHSKYRERWNRHYGISYEATFDLQSTLQSRMQAIIVDMELKLGVKTSFEDRPVMCWVIKDDSGTKPIAQSKNGQTIADFAFMLDLNGDIPPVVNESSNKGKYNFSGTTNAADLNVQLKKNGFRMVEEVRNISCFVLK